MVPHRRHRRRSRSASVAPRCSRTSARRARPRALSARKRRSQAQAEAARRGPRDARERPGAGAPGTSTAAVVGASPRTCQPDARNASTTSASNLALARAGFAFESDHAIARREDVFGHRPLLARQAGRKVVARDRPGASLACALQVENPLLRRHGPTRGEHAPRARQVPPLGQRDAHIVERGLASRVNQRDPLVAEQRRRQASGALYFRARLGTRLDERLQLGQRPPDRGFVRLESDVRPRTRGPRC